MTNLYWRLTTATMTGVAFLSILLDGVSGHSVPRILTGVIGILLSILIGAIFFIDWREIRRTRARTEENFEQIQNLYRLSDELRAKVRDLPDSH